ncbi:aldehyde dehydrogenase, partial [Verrucosispora sp. SN26_14.1]
MYTVAQLIGGVWGAGGEAGDLVVHDPATGAPVTGAPVATSDEVDKAVAAARGVAAEWAATP